MANIFRSFTIVIVAASFSQSAQIQNLFNSKVIKQNTQNDEKNYWGMDEDKRGNQRQWLVNDGRSSLDRAKAGLQAIANLNDKLNRLEDFMQEGLPAKETNPNQHIQISLLPSQIQKPDKNMHVYSPFIFYPDVLEALENNTGAYDDGPKRRGQVTPEDNKLKGKSLNSFLRQINPAHNVEQHFYAGDGALASPPGPEPDEIVPQRRIVKRFARNPKDTKRKKEKKQKAQKRRKKRKKDRMRKHNMRLRKQQSDKMKRKDKLRLRAKYANMTRNASEEIVADPNYDELYEISVEKKKQPDDSEDYSEDKGPKPGTYEMDSDDFRHVKYTIREKNSSECEPEWFDNIDISNMTESEINRRFVTDEEFDSNSDSSSTVIRKNLKKKKKQGVKDSDEGSESYEEGSESYEDEEGDDKGGEDEKSKEDEDDDDDGGGRNLTPDKVISPKKNKKTRRRYRDKKKKKSKGRDDCKNGDCKHEEHGSENKPRREHVRDLKTILKPNIKQQRKTNTLILDRNVGVNFKTHEESGNARRKLKINRQAKDKLQEKTNELNKMHKHDHIEDHKMIKSELMEETIKSHGLGVKMNDDKKHPEQEHIKVVQRAKISADNLKTQNTEKELKTNGKESEKQTNNFDNTDASLGTANLKQNVHENFIRARPMKTGEEIQDKGQNIHPKVNGEMLKLEEGSKTRRYFDRSENRKVNPKILLKIVDSKKNSLETVDDVHFNPHLPLGRPGARV